MELAELTDEQRDSLTQFQEITGIDSAETCWQYLRTHSWDTQRAINTYLISQSDPDATPSPSPSPDPVTTTNNHLISKPPTAITRYVPRFLLQLFRIPLSFLYTFYVKCQPWLPWNFARIAYTFFRSHFWPEKLKAPLEEIEEFRLYFESKYGSTHPTFYRGLLSQALRDAQREIRLLFIYLHDKNSASCDRFCHEVLCRDDFQTTIGDNLFWSTSRDTQEGLTASKLFYVKSYPCLCIVAHHGSQQIVPLKLERYSDRDMCLLEIHNAIININAILEEDRQRRHMSYSRDLLVEEQDAAYQASMLVDQEKAAQRLREENERRLLEEEQQKKLQAYAEFRESLKQTIPPEPTGSDPETIQVSIRLPADEPLRRRFFRHDPAKLLFEYAWTQSTVPDHFELLWGYPRKCYRYDQVGDQKIGDLIPGNTETCYLQEIDEDESEQ